MINKMIEEFENSHSFKRANENAAILSQYTEFSDDQIHRIAKAFLHNDQISGGFESGEWCISLIKENWKKLDKKLRNVLEQNFDL